jgi:hypothetical protein
MIASATQEWPAAASEDERSATNGIAAALLAG